MRRRGTAGIAVGLVFALAAVLDISSCSSNSGAAGLDQSCSLNSDCDQPLICAFARCHSACADSRDCMTAGERCVMSGTTGVCQLPSESTCATAACQSGEVCGPDHQCRTPCTAASASTDCAAGDYCVPSGTADACYSPSSAADEPVLVADGILSADGAVLGDGSVASIADGASPDGATSDATTTTSDGAGGTVDGGDGGPIGNSCPSAQTQFGNVDTGDSNPNFTSGVGIRGVSQVLIFSGYSATADAGDAGTQNSVYVQAFDPLTSASTGPAQPLFSVTGDAATVAVEAAASAPSGQVAVLYTFYTQSLGITGGVLAPPGYVANTVDAGLYVAFLDPSPDGGAGLKLNQIVQLESSAIYSQPHILWSAASQTFVISWEYYTSLWFLKVQKFLSDGRAAGGDTDVVPTDDSRDIPTQSDYEQGSVAAAGSLLGVAYISNSNYGAMLTVLDPQGNALGSPYLVGTAGSNSWVAAGGIAQGFVYFYDNGTNVTEVTVPTGADAGVLGLGPDGGNAVAFSTFKFPGALRANAARAIGDDTAGGVGIALLYPDGVSFGYVMADGATHVGADQVISHQYVAGDRIEISNLGGSFGVSQYSTAEHLTRVAASGCR